MPVHRCARAVLLALGVSVTILIMPRAMLILVDRADSAPVYTVAEVDSLLAHHAAAWNGRTIQVRGVVIECPYRLPGPCASWEPTLRDPQTRLNEAGAGLLLVTDPTRPHTLMMLLDRIPWFRALVQRSQAVQWGVVATYRVLLAVIAASSCGPGACYEAVLLDATPGMPPDS